MNLEVRKILLLLIGGLLIIDVVIFFSFLKFKDHKVEDVEKVNNQLFELKLNGDEIVNLNLNEEYVELGATVYLDQAELSDAVLIEGIVDTSTVGSYEITYSFRNEKVTRIINITYNGKAIDASLLEDFLSGYGNSISVCYQNLKTGFKYCHNANQVYYAASVIKAPYSLFVYEQTETNPDNLKSVHVYNREDYIGGTGVIKNMPVGTKFSEEEILKYALQNSDNIAFRKLVDKYGIAEFKNFVKQLGGDASLINNVLNASMNASDACLYAEAIYQYLEGINQYGEHFKNNLALRTNKMITSDFPIFRKYGWAEGAFHDMAIIYSTSPYVLIIMSARDKGTATDYRAFNDISKEIQNFNETNFVEN